MNKSDRTKIAHYFWGRLKDYQKFIDLSKGDQWEFHESRQVCYDCLYAAKRWGLIEDFAVSPPVLTLVGGEKLIIFKGKECWWYDTQSFQAL